jgi:hypothetical protein
VNSNKLSAFLSFVFRDSFGENDDSCFDLLERYDNSAAILRLIIRIIIGKNMTFGSHPLNKDQIFSRCGHI